LRAFDRALQQLEFDRDAMDRSAGSGFTVATDLADKLIAEGASARDAHARIGGEIVRAEAAAAPLPLTPQESIRGKRTIGSTAPQQIAAAIEALERDLDAVEASL
jgi:argininosuccinate lyase